MVARLFTLASLEVIDSGLSRESACLPFAAELGYQCGLIYEDNVTQPEAEQKSPPDPGYS
jgi:hypothetical protein